jgi:peroxiredoxin
MKRIFKIHLFAFLLLSLQTQLYSQENEGQDAAISQETFVFIESYLDGIPNVRDSLIAACDLLIGSATNKEAATSIAGYLFNRFSTSRVMGDESVAIHISQNYFLNGKLEWQGDGGLALLRLYTEFNENSLLGMKAPSLELNRPDGTTLSLHNIKSRFTLLYFFDSSCNSCREQLPSLAATLARYSHLNLTVYAIYTQTDTAGLNRFREEFAHHISATGVNWNFVYDPGNSSNFHKLYNVLSTPRIYLLDHNKTIIGRNLANTSLNHLLDTEEKKLSHMHSVAEGFVPQYLSLFDLSDTTQYSQAFDPLFDRIIRENPEMLNPLFYHIFEYLAGSGEEHLKQCALHVAHKYIQGKPEYWHDHPFTDLRVPQVVSHIVNNSNGSAFPMASFSNKRGRSYNFGFDRYQYTYIYFFNPGCAICKPFTFELKKIYKTLKRRGVKVVAIHTAGSKKEVREYLKEAKVPWDVLYYNPDNILPLHQIYESELLPMTYLVDNNGIIQAKVINTIKLLELIQK